MKDSNAATNPSEKGYNASQPGVKFKEPSWSIEWIDSQSALDQAATDLAREPLLSVDTETAGWETGNERLCLIQIGIPSQDHILIIDPLAINSLESLGPVLESPTPELIAHNAPFEERQFGRHGMKLRGIIDTLSMARKLRPDLPNHKLQTCCKYLLDVQLTKEQQASDWSRRPLSADQLKYAALDAEITFALYRVLAEMEAKLVIDPELSVPQLMKIINQTVEHRLKLTRDISAELAFLNAQYDMLRDAIRLKLIEGEKAYDGEFGHCKLSRVKQTEVDPIALRLKYPQIAADVINEEVDRKKLQVLAKKFQIDPEEIEKITRITGFSDRLSLSVKTAE